MRRSVAHLAFPVRGRRKEARKTLHGYPGLRPKAFERNAGLRLAASSPERRATFRKPVGWAYRLPSSRRWLPLAVFEPDGDGPLDLLPLALSRPNEALERARTILARDPGPIAASIARQAIGIVLREYGDVEAAVDELRIARRLARRAGSAGREADVLGTLGVALIFAGRSTSGRNALDAAVRQSTGHSHRRMLFRRGAALLILGRHREALEDLNTAIIAMRAADDQTWEARALQERAVSYLASGLARRAVADLRRAEELFGASGQELESAEVTVNRGLVALRLGDLPEALSCFDKAAERFQRLGTPEPDLSMHRCAALTAAGLFGEAMHEAEAAIGQLDQIHGRPTKRAELLLTAAKCALAAGEPATAVARATDARRLFDRQGRRWWRAHAELARVSALVAAGPATAALLRDAQRCVRELSELSSPDQPLAQLAAGRVALALGRTAVASEHLAAAAADRRHGPLAAAVTGGGVAGRGPPCGSAWGLAPPDVRLPAGPWTSSASTKACSDHLSCVHRSPHTAPS